MPYDQVCNIPYRALAINMVQCLVIILVKLPIMDPEEIICQTKDANCLAEILNEDPVTIWSIVSNTF